MNHPPHLSSSFSIDGIQLDPHNEEFNNALALIEETNTPLIYLTGKAGTGKTTFLKYLKKVTQKKLVVVAPTGVAAINAGGQTIHSFFKIEPSPFVPDDKRLRKSATSDTTDRRTIFDVFQYNSQKRKLIEKLEVLVIDEISMVRCDLLDVIDRLLRVFRKKEYLPFGGVQVLLIGDTCQLPPITPDDQKAILRPYYKTGFNFFNAHVVEQHTPLYIELKKIYRQKEQEFIDLLNRVRIDKVTDEDIAKLRKKLNPTFEPADGENYITLATKNRIVDDYNKNKLDALDTELVEYSGVITGSFPNNELPVPRDVEFKVGAQVMLLKNNLPTYCNGTIGKITELTPDVISVKIEKLGSQEIVDIERATWEKIEYIWNEEEKKVESKVVGTYSQFPVKLAWAITVHKSQGLTFEKAVLDVGDSFTTGQVYVALSRCTTFEGLVLKSHIAKKAIKVSQEAIEFAKKETPNTLIASELQSARANTYYKNARTAAKTGDYTTCLEELSQAIELRNDIGTDIFKRYVVAFAKKLQLYKDRHFSHLKERKIENSKLSSIQTELNAALQSLHTLNEEQEELKEENNELRDNVSVLRKEVANYKRKTKRRDENIELLKTTVRDLETAAEQNASEFAKSKQIVQTQATQIQKLQTEIERLQNLKWYQRLKKLK